MTVLSMCFIDWLMFRGFLYGAPSLSDETVTGERRMGKDLKQIPSEWKSRSLPLNRFSVSSL
jgi:hypothetical protein